MGDEERFCEWHRCGKILVQQEGETDWRFERRRTCGRSCAGHLINERRSENGTSRAAPRAVHVRLPITVEIQAKVRDAVQEALFRNRMMRGALR